jgi:hypothetical protein
MIAKTQKTATTHAAMALPILRIGEMRWITTRQNGLNSNVCAWSNDLAYIISRWFRNIGATIRINVVLGEHPDRHRLKGRRMIKAKEAKTVQRALKRQWRGSRKDIHN